MFIAELSLSNFADYDLTSLRTGIMAGSSCPGEQMKRVMRDMSMDEVTIAYGMTETSPVSWQSVWDTPLEQRVHTVGRVHPHVECKVVAADGDEDGDGAGGGSAEGGTKKVKEGDGMRGGGALAESVASGVGGVGGVGGVENNDTPRTMPVGEAGELWTRGYLVMPGYHANPEATSESITADGWMKTGDLAIIDGGGYCSIVGRIKDTIIRGGENIAPVEVENVLFTHAAVLNVSVVGVPDDTFGEQVCACVIRAPGASVPAGDDDASVEADIRAFSAERLAHFKVPKYIRFIDAEQLPMTVSGKVQKNLLRERSAVALGLV